MAENNFLVLYDCNCAIMRAHGMAEWQRQNDWSGRDYVQWTERARQRWDTESEEEKEVRFCWKRESDRQWQDTEIEDELEARLPWWREIGRGELLWTLSHLAYITASHTASHMNRDPILITESHSSLSLMIIICLAVVTNHSVVSTLTPEVVSWWQVVHIDAGVLCLQKCIEIESSSGAIFNIKLLIHTSSDHWGIWGNVLGTSWKGRWQQFDTRALLAGCSMQSDQMIIFSVGKA